MCSSFLFFGDPPPIAADAQLARKDWQHTTDRGLTDYCSYLQVAIERPVHANRGREQTQMMLDLAPAGSSTDLTPPIGFVSTFPRPLKCMKTT